MKQEKSIQLECVLHDKNCKCQLCKGREIGIKEGYNSALKDKRIKCIYCKQPIHIDNFAGITKKGMICGKASCLIKLVKEMSKIRKARGKNERI